MLKIFALAIFLTGAAGVVLTGMGLRETLAKGLRIVPVQTVTAAAVEPLPPKAPLTPPFLPIFGTPAPVGATLPPDQPEQVSLGFSLKGVVASGQMRWAILTGPGGDLLVREGDRLDGGAEIGEIHAEGIEVRLDGKTRVLGFSTSAPVAVTKLAAEETPVPSEADRPAISGDVLPRPKAQEVIFQGMSREELLTVLQAAEEKRRARGWIPESR